MPAGWHDGSQPSFNRVDILVSAFPGAAHEDAQKMDTVFVLETLFLVVEFVVESKMMYASAGHVCWFAWRKSLSDVSLRKLHVAWWRH